MPTEARFARTRIQPADGNCGWHDGHTIHTPHEPVRGARYFDRRVGCGVTTAILRWKLDVEVRGIARIGRCLADIIIADATSAEQNECRNQNSRSGYSFGHELYLLLRPVETRIISFDLQLYLNWPDRIIPAVLVSDTFPICGYPRGIRAPVHGRSPQPGRDSLTRDGGIMVLSLRSDFQAVRVIENFGAGLVYKHPASELKREIVIFPYNGKTKCLRNRFPLMIKNPGFKFQVQPGQSLTKGCFPRCFELEKPGQARYFT